MDTELDRLRFPLVCLREPPPSREAEQQALGAFERELGRKAGREEERGERGPQGRN